MKNVGTLAAAWGLMATLGIASIGCSQAQAPRGDRAAAKTAAKSSTSAEAERLCRMRGMSKRIAPGPVSETDARDELHKVATCLLGGPSHAKELELTERPAPGSDVGTPKAARVNEYLRSMTSSREEPLD